MAEGAVGPDVTPAAPAAVVDATMDASAPAEAPAVPVEENSIQDVNALFRRLLGIHEQLQADGLVSVNGLDQGYTVDVETREMLYKPDY
jgi:hypothetical protein